MTRSMKTTFTDLRSEWGMACPKCGWAQSLTIEIRCSAVLTVDGTEPHGDHEWEHTSACSCDRCDHHGVVADFSIYEDAQAQPCARDSNAVSML